MNFIKNAKMRICIVTPIFPPEIGGPATYSYELGSRLKDKHDIIIIAFGDVVSSLNGVEIYNIKIKHYFFGTLFRQISLLYALYKKRKQFDHIYAQDPLTVGLAGFIFAKLFNKKYIIKFVGDVVWETASRNAETDKQLEEYLMYSKGVLYDIMWQIQKIPIKYSKNIITPSEYLRNILIKYYNADPLACHVVNNSINISNSNYKKITDGNKSINVITVSRLEKWKNIEGIIFAVNSVKKNGHNINLNIIGEGSEYYSLKGYIQKYGLQDNVKLLGRKKQNETMGYIVNSDMFILNSTYEGLPHVVIEAMSMHVPVIATNIPGTNEIAIDNKTAVLVEVGNNDQIADAILKISKDKEFKSKIVENAFELVKERYNWDVNLNKIERIIEGAK